MKGAGMRLSVRIDDFYGEFLGDDAAISQDLAVQARRRKVADFFAFLLDDIRVHLLLIGEGNFVVENDDAQILGGADV